MWLNLLFFLAASFVMIWRLEVMAGEGFEGTVLGTIIMPYCTGVGNLMFAVVLGWQGGDGGEVLTNCVVNNVTNLTLLVGLPVAIWGSARARRPAASGAAGDFDRFSMLLTLVGVLFFTAVAWMMARQQAINFFDGLLLIGLFLCWQGFHIFDMITSRRRRRLSFRPRLLVDLLILAVCSYVIYLTTKNMVAEISRIHSGFISARYLGWLSGWLDVLPNGAVAFYYGWKRMPEVVYTSQVGDGHVCIPLCMGIFALFRAAVAPPFFETGVLMLGGAAIVHLTCIGIFGYLPRAAGWALTAAYFYFVYAGLLK